MSVCIGITILSWLLGALFFWLKGNAQRELASRQKVCTNMTDATVIQMDRKRVKRSDSYSYCWYPTYEYYADDVRYEKESTTGYGKKMFEEGDTIELYYNPDNPVEVYIPVEKEEDITTIFLILAIGFFVAGFIPPVILFFIFR